MKFIDMHCDTLMYYQKEQTLFDAKTQVDFKKMDIGGQFAQFFAIFLLPKDECTMSDWEYIHTLRNYLLENLKKHKEMISLSMTADEILTSGKMSAVLTLEDGRVVDGELENLKTLYELGIRAISLTWNHKNCFGSPNSLDKNVMNEGLTDFGKDAISYMQELGIMVDVSHLSDGGFFDVVDICKKPFIATHSNSRALCNHPRNLTDEMIRLLANKGGVTGLNYYYKFLGIESSAAIIAKHARHIANVGGVECVGLGSDFDGFSGETQLSDCSKLYLLEDALKKEDFSKSDIEKIFYKNVLRVMKETIK
ncbi:Microsomal dipeptidase [Lachnospiraceae bacterium TWA4]|nr:Microsomal dipeptidase [Lachnospiraceae bacterium TWA4]